VDLRFTQPDSLIWLWTVIAAVAVLIIAAARRRRAMSRLATANLVGRFERAIGPTRRGWRSVMLAGSLLLLVAAMLDPRMGVRYEQVAQRNIDVVFALDTSRSMLAEDLRPNRLTRAKQYIEDVLGEAVGDRFGLVVYGGTPTLKVPLTRDLHAMRMALDEITPRTGRRGGSMMGDAIRLSEDALSIGEEGFKTIVVLSDGDDMGSYPVEAAAVAAESGISIWTVGLGDEAEGGRIPIDVNGERLFLTHDGQQVWSQLKPTILQEVAAAAGGQYIPGGTANLDLADIYDRIIAPATGKRIESARVERAIPRYRWCIGAALLLLAIESVLGLHVGLRRGFRGARQRSTPPVSRARRAFS
jgi:Ca-activated chloride channel family protein